MPSLDYNGGVLGGQLMILLVNHRLQHLSNMDLESTKPIRTRLRLPTFWHLTCQTGRCCIMNVGVKKWPLASMCLEWMPTRLHWYLCHAAPPGDAGTYCFLYAPLYPGLLSSPDGSKRVYLFNSNVPAKRKGDREGMDSFFLKDLTWNLKTFPLNPTGQISTQSHVATQMQRMVGNSVQPGSQMLS